MLPKNAVTPDYAVAAGNFVAIDHILASDDVLAYGSECGPPMLISKPANASLQTPSQASYTMDHFLPVLHFLSSTFLELLLPVTQSLWGRIALP
jgi:hypothetical protein